MSVAQAAGGARIGQKEMPLAFADGLQGGVTSKWDPATVIMNQRKNSRYKNGTTTAYFHGGNTGSNPVGDAKSNQPLD